MEQNTKQMLTGVFPPMMTPFTKEQNIDLDAVVMNVEKYNQTPIRGLMPLGSNGEYASLDDDESILVVKAVSRVMAASKTLMAGVGRESAYHTVEFSKRVANEGVHFVSILAPHYFHEKMTDDALLAYYEYIADHVPVPVLLYNAPKFASGVCLSASLVKELSKHSNIVGIKDTSKENIKVYIDATAGNDFHVLAGSITKYYSGLESGACGGILSSANYLPLECCRIQDLWINGKQTEAKILSDKLVELTSTCSGKTGIAGSKACMTLMGYTGGIPRLPLLPVDDNTIQHLNLVLREAGYLK